MKIPNKRDILQIAFNHSPDLDFKDLMNLYKKYTTKPYLILVIDATRVLGYPLCFRKHL